MDVAARACFDPSEAIRCVLNAMVIWLTCDRVWQRMSASDNGDRALDFLSTHPGHQDRIEKLQEYLPHVSNNTTCSYNI